MSLTKSLLLPLEGTPKTHPGKSPLVQKTVFFLFTLFDPSRPSFWSPLGHFIGGLAPSFGLLHGGGNPVNFPPDGFPCVFPSGYPSYPGFWPVLALQIPPRGVVCTLFWTSRYLSESIWIFVLRLRAGFGYSSAHRLFLGPSSAYPLFLVGNKTTKRASHLWYQKPCSAFFENVLF